MVGRISLNTMVNGKAISGSAAQDPFEMRRFPYAVDSMKTKTLDRMGQDIVSVARMLASGDPDVESMDVSYSVDGGELKITSNQVHSTGYSALRETGHLYREEPKQHVLRATLAVMKGKGTSSTHTMTAQDIVKQWRSRRTAGASRPGGGISMSTMAGMLAVGSAYYSGVPL